MTVNEILASSPAWLANGDDGDVVLSCRIRLARNVANIAFPAQADEKSLARIIELAKSIVEDLQKEFKQEFVWIDLAKLKEIERQVLVEKHLISPLQASMSTSRAVIVSCDNLISIMVNEEDHFRIQVMLPGLALGKAMEIADKIDDILEEKIDFAFDDSFGYLTACPTNMGTALRATAMLHMLGIALNKQLDNMTQALAQVGFIVRGMYGEGSDVLGDIFQVSNQLAMGYSEKEIIDSMTETVKQVATQERLARVHLLSKDSLGIKDMVYRGLGILSYALCLQDAEAMSLYSRLLLGINLGILSMEKEVLYDLMINTRQNHILKMMINLDKQITKEELRAQFVKGKLAQGGFAC